MIRIQLFIIIFIAYVVSKPACKYICYLFLDIDTILTL